MNAQEAYVHAIFKTIYVTAAINVSYDEADEMWYVLVDRPARTVGGIEYPPVSFHYAMQVTSDDDDYCFTDSDDPLNVVRFPIVTDEIFAIWEDDDAAMPPVYTEPAPHGL